MTSINSAGGHEKSILSSLTLFTFLEASTTAAVMALASPVKSVQPTEELFQETVQPGTFKLKKNCCMVHMLFI